MSTHWPQEPPESLREEGRGEPEERYGFEELVAELGAAFLCGTCGLDNSSRLDDASAYLPGGSRRFETIRSSSCRRPAPRRRRPISSSVKPRSRRRKSGSPREANRGRGRTQQGPGPAHQRCMAAATEFLTIDGPSAPLWQTPYRRRSEPTTLIGSSGPEASHGRMRRSDGDREHAGCRVPAEVTAISPPREASRTGHEVARVTVRLSQ